MKRVALAAMLLVGQFIACDAAMPNQLYWVDEGNRTINRGALDGSNSTPVVSLATESPISLALDPIDNAIYWTQIPQSIARSNLDGSAVETVIQFAFGGAFSAIAVDSIGKKLYWTDSLADSIRRANLDGTNVEVVLTGVIHSNGIALDVAAGKMYWTESSSGQRIRRANLDGSQVEDLITTGLVQPSGISLDLVGQKLYFTDSVRETIERTNLDGTGRETLLAGADLTFPAQIALDVDGGKLYWTEASSTTGKTRRASLDGSQIEDLFFGSNPIGIAVLHIVPEPRTISLLLPTIVAIMTTSGRPARCPLPDLERPARRRGRPVPRPWRARLLAALGHFR
jgi:hypothetical protein